MVSVRITVDGRTYEDDVEARTLLVHHLRDRCGSPGTNVGCDTSSCGACTVHFDGRSIKSCTLFAVQADGANIDTINGLAPGEDSDDPAGWHPLQRAFHTAHGLQCGYCTPGMIMAAADLLGNNPDPSEDEVRQGLEGNLCRCTGYNNIVTAVRLAADEMRAGWSDD